MAATVATTQFANLSPDRVFDNNYSKEFAFKRAMKVFLISYSHYKTLCPQLYEQKFDEYMQTIEDLFDFNPQNMDFIQQLETEVMNQNIGVTAGVIKFKGRDQVVNPRVIIIPGEGLKYTFELNCTSEAQTDSKISKVYDYQRFQELFSDDQTLVPSVVVKLEADTWVHPEESLNTFVIPYKTIHCEGFEDWFDFGRGVQLLIKIEFNTSAERNFTVDDAAKYHLHTIHYMVGKRLDQFRLAHRPNPCHLKIAHKKKFSYIRPGIDLNTEEAFWPPVTPLNTLQAIKQSFSDSKAFKKSLQTFKTIKFNDLQIGYHFHDQFEDSVCLCSEWCNWNAFFHFNPIYRFLMVRNNQLFLRNRTTVPDLYLSSTVYHLSLTGVGQQPNILRKTPLLQLMYCANDYRMRYYNSYYLKSRVFAAEYRRVMPSFGFLNGIAYNLLSYDVDIEALCLQLDTNPFADICLESLSNYYKVFYNLHVLMSTINPFVPIDLKKEWFDEWNVYTHEKYRNYLKICYDKLLASNQMIIEYVFSEDFQYSSRLPKTDSEVMVRNIRQNVLSFKEPMNPFNIRIITNTFLSSFISVSKYFHKLSPILPTPYSTEAVEDIFECCHTYEQDFTTYAGQGLTFNFFNYTGVYESELKERGLEHMEKEVMIFFTLKLYAIGYDIQSYCIQSILGLQEEYNYNKKHVSNQFEFIFSNTLIEQRYQNEYPGERLFELKTAHVNSFNEFYCNFWGPATHERMQFHNLPDFVSSGRSEYERLEFWWRNNGNSRLKFAAIFLNLEIAFNDITDSSEEIFKDCLLPSIEVLSQRYEYFSEVFDYLVYYLVKGNCFMIFSTIVSLLKEMHKLQQQVLCDADVGYYLSKPGWVQLFRTLESVYEYLDHLRVLYVVFDEELERISETLIQTKQMVKKMFKNFYSKLLYEWFEELRKVYIDQQNVPEYLIFIPLHTAVGVSFLAAFIDYFRSEAQYFRKSLRHLIAFNPNPTFRHQVQVHTIGVIVTRYLRRKDAINEATPLLSTIWSQSFQQVFNKLMQNTEQDVGINMSVADVF